MPDSSLRVNQGVMQGLGAIPPVPAPLPPLPEVVQAFKAAQIPELSQSDRRVADQIAQFLASNPAPDLSAQIGRYLSRHSSELSVSYDELTGHYVARVVSRETGELIRQIPQEEMLRVARNIDLVRGKLVSLIA
jgi:flagellar protein FlaG